VVKALPVPEAGNKVHYFPGAILQGKEAPRGFGVRVSSGRALLWTRTLQRRTLRSVPYMTGKIEVAHHYSTGCLGAHLAWERTKDAGARGSAELRGSRRVPAALGCT
jgi:hypothetical protein